MQTIIITAFITAILCTIGFVSRGQTFSEWFRQKKTKIKYLKKQIAALEVLKAAIRKGGAQVKKDVDTIDVIEQDLVELDGDYLTSLGNVNPVFRNDQNIDAAFQFARVLIRTSAEKIKTYSKSQWLTAAESAEIKFNLELVKNDMQNTLASLLLCITDGKLTMEDDERWNMIRGIEEHIQIAGRFQMMHILQTDEFIGVRRQQIANDEYLKKNLQ
ncbi:MAG: hypothetical protein J0H74_22490 [Chitinophagaceae bacterium]|nr:hypothetical protein [Chitinophagaceae bacterium]